MASRTNHCACGRQATHHGASGSSCDRCHAIELRWREWEALPARVVPAGMDEYRVVFSTRGAVQRAWEQWLGVRE